VVDEVESFARRRPGVFLALAAGTRLIAGRLIRGMKAASSDDQEPAAPATPGTAPEAGTWTRDPAEAAYQAGMGTGASADVPVPAGDSLAADRVPAASTERADRGPTPLGRPRGPAVTSPAGAAAPTPDSQPSVGEAFSDVAHATCGIRLRPPATP
jgi:hypothetical protein